MLMPRNPVPHVVKRLETGAVMIDGSYVWDCKRKTLARAAAQIGVRLVGGTKKADKGTLIHAIQEHTLREK
jgi:hypothetical protein